jgi:UDP-N-acetylmuramoylalanine--D-glutamate ligase
MINVTSFRNKSIGVLGLGRSGLSAVRALEAGGADVWAWDDVEEKREGAKLSGVSLTNLYNSDLAKIDTLILSPGIPDQYPEPHPLTVEARKVGCAIICDIDLLARENNSARFIGISGTNGKSTTTSLVGHIFNRANYQTEIGGNYGVPALDLQQLDSNGTYVLEISSYQLERIPCMELDIAILLNISADHLDRHGGMEGYIAAKKILFERSKGDSKTIIGMEDIHCRSICMELMLERGIANIIPISASARMPGGVYIDNGVLIDDLKNKKDVILDLSGIATLPGEHNWQNAAAAYAAARSAGIETDKIINGLKSYQGLSHRQELIKSVDGVSFINDSKATNTGSAAKALACYDNIHWIVGGQFKEENLGALQRVLKKVEHAYIIGSNLDKLENLLSPFLSVSRCGNLEKALQTAYHNACLAKPSTILLSPACASFDQFADFEERGQTFRHLIQNLESLSS